MGDTWIPQDVFCMEPFIRNFFENTATVQVTFFPLMISLQICSCLHEKEAQLQKIVSSWMFFPKGFSESLFVS